jgi:hypothetical protein
VKNSLLTLTTIFSKNNKDPFMVAKAAIPSFSAIYIGLNQ